MSLLFLLASAADVPDGSCDMADADRYLKDFGIPSNLPQLEVKYGHFTTGEVFVNGAETQLSMDNEAMLRDAPRVKWLQDSEDEGAKYAVLMVDPDWFEAGKSS